MSLRVRVSFSLIVLYFCCSRAASASIIDVTSAVPIGTFEWVYDTLFGTGSTFSLTNESEKTFDAIFVDLYAGDGSDPFRTLDLGTVLGGGITQSIDDLSLLTVPTDIARAHLRFTLAGDLVGADLLATELSGESEGLTAVSVDILGPQASPEPVPEPSTLALLASGVLIALRRRRGVRHSRAGDRAAAVGPTCT